jgi:hypothetical protein
MKAGAYLRIQTEISKRATSCHPRFAGRLLPSPRLKEHPTCLFPLWSRNSETQIDGASSDGNNGAALE